jgi:hypothetical protein
MADIFQFKIYQKFLKYSNKLEYVERISVLLFLLK